MTHIKKFDEMFPINENIKETALKNCEKRNADIVASELYGKIIEYAKRSNDDICVISFEYGNRGYGIRPFGQGCEERERNGECMTTYTLDVLGNEYEFESTYTISSICDKIVKLTKNDNRMIVKTKEVGNYPNYYELISEICHINKVAKEFTQIQKYLLKYANFKLTEDMCYSAPTSGKRGEYYEHNDERSFACTNQKRCAAFIEKLKTTKSPKDTLTIEQVEYSDKEDMSHSIYYETECYGSIQKTIKVIIKTPTGRIKSEIYL